MLVAVMEPAKSAQLVVVAVLLTMQVTAVVAAWGTTVGVGVGVDVGKTATASGNLQFHVEIGPTLAAASMVQAAIFHISLLPPALQLSLPRLMRPACRAEIGLRVTANLESYATSFMMLA